MNKVHYLKKDKIIEDTELWANDRLNELLLVDKFKELGKENEPVFQTLVFLGNGSHQLSLGSTILGNYKEIPKELKIELKAIQQQLNDFQEKLRDHRNGEKAD